MNEFFHDLIRNLEGYYKQIVDITPKFLLAIIVIVIVWLIATRVRTFTDRRLKSRMHDPLLATFIANLVKAVLLIVGVFLMFRIIGLTTMASSLLAGAGISAFVIGFALKDIGENFLAGILLAFKRPFSVGDIIESNGVKGKVLALNLRDTQIISDGKDIFIPNALLIKSTLINYNRGGFLLQDFTVGLEFGSDYRKAISLVKELLKQDISVTDGRENIVVISGIVGTAPQLNVRYWVETDDKISNGRVRSEVLIKILEALKENGFVVKKD
ncbi:mechanosensitive ion channel family protein [Flavobacterium selenitireducens]|uniref:mechanosensitive ion channel family protein n=1 Tax=Flavobacterium selenitireducens TaxID=2722704 RepID=UPI00168BDA9A|nr:mechanosensitive ion channel domain-containing protein [Flavobacterium selenitireducens]MBD3581272.1 mechanosensitive ion channel [Flavobacterium selenitireducens]